jgi:hypothetical protein
MDWIGLIVILLVECAVLGLEILHPINIPEALGIDCNRKRVGFLAQ